MLSNVYPLSLRIEFNVNLLNQYRKKQELKGKTGYDYYNVETFGDLINVKGFFKSSIIS
jgi:hypothetical protein